MAEINFDDYKPNSFLSKKTEVEKKDISPVVTNATKKRKKRGIQKFLGAFFTENPSDIRNSILTDVIVPGIKKAIDDAIHTILYPGTKGRSSSSPASKISYRSYYDYKEPSPYSDRAPVRTVMDYDDVIFESRGDAELVLAAMEDIIRTYSVVSIAQFYELAKIPEEASWTNNRYGWKDISSARVMAIGRDEYIIRFPKAMPID